MHIKDLDAHIGPQLSTRPPALSPARPIPPVAMDVTFEAPVSPAQHVVAGVKRIKETRWYRVIRKRGFHFVPLGHRDGVLVLVVGTAASLGATYLAYKRLKKGHDVAAAAQYRRRTRLPLVLPVRASSAGDGTGCVLSGLAVGGIAAVGGESRHARPSRCWRVRYTSASAPVRSRPLAATANIASGVPKRW